MSYGESMDRLLEELSRLPGVGRKTAERLAHHVLRMPREDADRLARAIHEVKRKTRSCSVCSNVTEQDPCAICSDARRDPRRVCVVEQARSRHGSPAAGTLVRSAQIGEGLRRRRHHGTSARLHWPVRR